MREIIYNFYAKKTIKNAKKIVKKSKFFFDKYSKLSDEEIKKEYEKISNKIQKISVNYTEHKKFLPQLLGMIKTASERTIGINPYDVQLIGAVILDAGKIAEMKTGEGKTLTASISAIINSVYGKSIHIVTVNDYLAKRDAETMRPLYNFFGLDTGVIYSNQSMYEKYEMYLKPVVYATNTELGFDYLRDNTVNEWEEKVFRGERFFVIIDEVDSVLIDEARTPLIISNKEINLEDINMYLKAKDLAEKLKRNKDYEVDKKNKSVILTEDGLKKAESFLKINNLYEDKRGILFAHRLNNAIYAKELLNKDKDYTIRINHETGKEEVILIDEFTGRLSIGRSLSDGLHQAIEAKEGINITPENKTMAKITYPNFFNLYKKVAGMTGTALTQREEFMEIYRLEVIPVPTNEPVIRKDKNDFIFGSSETRDKAVIKNIKELHKKKQPVLVGTTNVETSERISVLLKKEGISHEVLNAKNNEREAEIIAKAGQKGAVTISTNMAGRGTDIKLGEGVKELGGLFVLGVERNENRRIDDQLIGRAGRQGDPGESRFFLSLEDKLLQIFGGESVKRFYKTMKEEKKPIESKFLTRAIKKAQKNIEGMYFEMRKNLLKYDNALDKQRKMYYKMRDFILLAKKEDFIEKINRYTEEINLSKEKTQKVKEIIDFIAKNESINEERFFKNIFIRIMDEEFLDFLNAVEILREGIHLRGMSQKDPFVEYNRESFMLFENFINNVKKRILEEVAEIDIEQIKRDIETVQNSFDKEQIVGMKVENLLENIVNNNEITKENPLSKLDKKIIFDF